MCEFPLNVHVVCVCDCVYVCVVQCSPPAGLRYNHSDGDHPTVSAKVGVAVV